MFTLSLIKKCAYDMSVFDIKEAQEYADACHKFGLWWAYDCAKAYQHFTRSYDKIFWWKMVVKTFRYANDFQRRKGDKNDI